MHKTDPLAGKVLANHRLVKRIGRGAMAAVYEALDAKGERHALKLLVGDAARDAEFVKRFHRESKLQAKFKHPNLVAVYGFGVDHGVNYLAMELIDGHTLEEHIDHKGAMDWRKAADLVMQVAKALEHLHSNGVIHRDIKPANILLGAGGVAKLTDLGFAKRLDEPELESGRAATTDAGLTLSGVSMGSPAYMPPEQVEDAKTVGAAADIYSLAASLYHAVTGSTPHDGRNVYEVMEKVLREPIPPACTVKPDLPAGLGRFLAWAMDKDPSRRPADPAVFMRELAATIAAPDDAKRFDRLMPSSVPAAGQRAGGRGLVVLTAVLTVVAVAGAVCWWFLRRH